MDINKSAANILPRSIEQSINSQIIHMQNTHINELPFNNMFIDFHKKQLLTINTKPMNKSL